jgi:hypothetical protein
MGLSVDLGKLSASSKDTGTAAGVVDGGGEARSMLVTAGLGPHTSGLHLGAQVTVLHPHTRVHTKEAAHSRVVQGCRVERWVAQRLKGANGKGEGTQEATNGESQDSMGLLFLLLCFVGQVGITAAGKRGANSRGPGRGRPGGRGGGGASRRSPPLSPYQRQSVHRLSSNPFFVLWSVRCRQKGWLT